MQSGSDNGDPKRRGSDQHTREIVHLTVAEIFDGVGVDFTTPDGRQRFRDNLAFLEDARSGTVVVRRAAVTGFFGAIGVALYKTWPAIALWLSK